MAATEPSITRASIVHARSDLLATALSDTESVMLDIDAGSYFGVESVARTIWDCISEPQSVAQVCTVVAQKYDATEEVVESDALEFLNQLLAAGLITVDGGAQP